MPSPAAFLSTTASTLALGLGPARRLAQPAAPAAPPVTNFTEIRRGVGFFTGSGGTIGYLVNGAGAVAIDSQFANTAAIAVAGLRQQAPQGIEMLLNTHHGDHTGGNQVFRGAVKRIVGT
jgi:glyoxylase-like metal-dependent hydrolase (beta-lactamase superfamily II)